MDIGLLGILRDEPMTFVLLALALIGAITLHEFAHAYVADLQGDRMPRAMGRVSLNPVRHLDPLGTLVLVLVGFGWGRPVEFRPERLASRRFGPALVALAGPLTNLVLAILGAFPLVALVDSGPEWLLLFLQLFVTINVLLAVFNLLPLPPLDGSRLLTIFLPPGKQSIVYFLDRYGFVILLALVFLTGFEFLMPVVRAVSNFVLRIAGA